MDRWARPAPLAAFDRVHREQALGRAQAPDPPLGDLVAAIAQLVGDQAIPELRVITMSVDRGVGRIGVDQVPLAHGSSHPGVVRLPGEPQHPAGHRDRHPHRGAGRGQLTDQRVDPHWGRLARGRLRSWALARVCDSRDIRPSHAVVS